MAENAAPKAKTKGAPEAKAEAKAGAKAETTPAPGSNEGGKAIVLFSDGTGNSSAKLFKTNVWRMYEAIDLGETDVDPEQIVYYDEGVGNSGFRPLAVLGGVFGWGLKRNVIELYSFLCRNYEPGDRIYAFGFSRGAFTIRVLVGLIAAQGVVAYKDEADLAHQSADAFRAQTRGLIPRFPPMRWLLPLWRAAVRGFLSLKRKVLKQRRYTPSNNHQPEVRFVGLWDTVAAYGGPIIELVRAFDDWIRPLTFKDTSLPGKVQTARHALSLDDERDAFQPVPWNEPPGLDRARLKQVWFAGAHADVGGGYPDDSLAYVSLAWMMKEAADAGLMLRPEIVQQANRIANAFGPIHDPRAGWGSYYRYQPRVVGAYVEPPTPGTESMGDPDLADQGIDHCAWIHDSVFYRIEAGTDGYAPITLPQDFRVVRSTPGDTQFPAPLRQNLAAVAEVRADRQETIRDIIWRKRVFYFAIVGLSLLLASMPLWPANSDVPLCQDDRCVASEAVGWLRFFVPGFAEPWLNAIAAKPIVTAIIVALILFFRWLGGVGERKLRDGTRKLWRQSLQGKIEMPARATWIRKMRTSGAYQGVLGFIKWHVLPIILGLMMLAILLWGVAIALTQTRLGWGEGRDLFCPRELPAQAAGEPNFRTDRPCNRLPATIRKGQTYEVRFYVGEPWRDGNRPQPDTAPQGIAMGDLDFPIGYVGAPFRRVIGAGYLQPLAGIERTRGSHPAVHIHTLALQQRADRSWSAEFTAATSGSLTLFANDAVPPWPFDPATFYNRGAASRNHGTACVAVSERDGDQLVPLVSCQGDCRPGAPPGACRAVINPKRWPPA